MSSAAIHRYGFDDLRRFGAAPGAAVGLPPSRSLAMASHLLWFDAAGAAPLGIATLPTWMEAISAGRVNPTASGRVTSERTALALFDGEGGPAPIVLERAAELAVQKAREAAVGLIRVVGTGPMGSSAAVAAGIAIGPMAGAVLGPGRSRSLALPMEGGLPMVVDSGLAAVGAGDRAPSRSSGRRGSGASRPPADGDAPISEGFWAASEVLLPEGGWLVAAVSVPALESLSAFDRRLSAVVDELAEAPGRLLPVAWEARRREARQKGVAVEPLAWKSLVDWARRFDVDVPGPMAG